VEDDLRPRCRTGESVRCERRFGHPAIWGPAAILVLAGFAGQSMPSN
jgi:hypothetical protein